MPFCTQCGKPVGATDTYCGVCGAKQATAAAGTGPSPGAGPSPGSDILNKLNEKNAAILCYLPVVGWIPAIAVLASTRFRGNRGIRFHAFQGLYLFVAWLLVQWFVSPMVNFGPHFGPQRGIVHVFELIIFGAWIFMLVKTSQNQTFHLPIIGEMAERSVAEQR
jgi:uncharacterized membrane protein